MSRRIVGQCSKCGDPAHPKGNVFRLMAALYYELDFGTERLGGIATANVKVCNNCDTAHPYQPRVSAKAKAHEAKLQATLAWLDANNT